MNTNHSPNKATSPLLPWQVILPTVATAVIALALAKCDEFGLLPGGRSVSLFLRWGLYLALPLTVGQLERRWKQAAGLGLWCLFLGWLTDGVVARQPLGQFQFERFGYVALAGGLVIYLILAYFFLLGKQLLQPPSKWHRTLTERHGWKLLLPCLLAAAVIFNYMRHEAKNLIGNHETLHLAGWNDPLRGLTVAALADFHCRDTPADLARLRLVVKQVNAWNCDLVLLLGDYSGYGYPSPQDAPPRQLTAELGKLRARHGVFAILGNHDCRGDWPAAYRQGFAAAGILLLDGRFITLTINGAPLNLAGFRGEIRQGRMLETPIDAWPDNGAPTLVLAHAPDYFVSFERPFSLMLSGPTHGGQIDWPILGPLVVPSQYGNRYRRGHHKRADGSQLLVSVGIGYTVLPLRWCCIPEINLLTLR